MAEFIGWTASIILLATILSQIYRQWSTGTSKGVSAWLFGGQIAASAGFTIYSWLLHNRVFIATNLLMFCSALVGLSLVLWHRRMNPSDGVTRS